MLPTLRDSSWPAPHRPKPARPQIFSALCANAALVHLDLADNQLGYKAARALGGALAANTTLAYLDISWNHLRPIDCRWEAPSFLPPPRPIPSLSENLGW